MSGQKDNTVWFEDYDEDFELLTGSRTLGETDIVLFASFVGLHEGLFLSEVDAAAYPFRRRVAPGIMTIAYCEGLVAQSGLFRGAGLIFLGIKESRAIAPVLMGDTIRVRISFVEKKAYPEKGRGAVTYRHDVINQRGETVMVYKVSRMIATRAGGAGLKTWLPQHEAARV
ncbi:MAG: MaoC/PaaZ C-terminal domain-containing protein [Rubrivivax sp.]